MYKVKEVAELSGVSVRTLHHYDHIGLLSPGVIGENRYRYYGVKELERLQQILFFREMEVPLENIKRILDDPAFDQRQSLHQHKQLLLVKKLRLERLIDSVDQTLASLGGGNQMSTQDRFEPFDRSEIDEHQKKYEQEVKDRWGDTDAYKESQRKTDSYTDEDWKRIQKEGAEIDRQIVKLIDQGPDDPEVQRLIGEKRQHITNNFYDCKLEIFRGLADMYVDDHRFRENIDAYKEGYAAFLRKSMHIYCDRLSD